MIIIFSLIVSGAPVMQVAILTVFDLNNKFFLVLHVKNI